MIEPTTTHPRGGFTLLELVVVLVILGLTLSLVFPTMRIAAETDPGELQRAIGLVRREALRRAESLVLTVHADGRWTAERGGDVAPLLDGTVSPAPGAPFRLRISPLGACLVASGSTSALVVDPTGCELRRP